MDTLDEGVSLVPPEAAVAEKPAWSNSPEASSEEK